MSHFLCPLAGYFKGGFKSAHWLAAVVVVVFGAEARDLTAQPQQVQPIPSVQSGPCYREVPCANMARPKCVPLWQLGLDLNRPTNSPNDGYENTSTSNHCGVRRYFLFIAKSCGPPPAVRACHAEAGPPVPFVDP